MPAFPRFAINTHWPDDRVVVVAVDGELKLENAPLVRRELGAAVEDPAQPAIVVDLTELQFIDSMGLAALVETARVLRQRGRRELMVVGSSTQVKRVFALTQIDRAVRMMKSVDEALRSAQ